MDIRQLKVFIAVAGGNKVTMVAEKMGMTKGAVSHILNNIEKELGTALFVNKYMQLTECGLLFLATAKKTIAVYEDGIEMIHALRGEVTGDLKIGVGSFVEPVIRKAVAKLLKDNPNLRVDAHVYRASTLNQLLKSGAIDVAFTMNEAVDGEGIVSEPCIPVKIMAVMSKTHTLAKKNKVTFEDLCRYDCIMPSEDRRSFATINKFVDFDLLKLRNKITINTADGALNMVEEENYITFMTVQHIVNRPNLTAIPIEGMEMEITSNIHYLEGVHLKRSARVLKDVIAEYAVPLMRMYE